MTQRFWTAIQWTALVLGVPFFMASSLLADLSDFAERKAAALSHADGKTP